MNLNVLLIVSGCIITCFSILLCALPFGGLDEFKTIGVFFGCTLILLGAVM
jgi:hypothetical protein